MAPAGGSFWTRAVGGGSLFTSGTVKNASSAGGTRAIVRTAVAHMWKRMASPNPESPLAIVATAAQTGA